MQVLSRSESRLDAMSLVLHSTRPCERFEEMGGGVARVLLSSRTTSCETTAQTLRPSISPAPRPRRWLRSQTCHKQHSRVRTLHALSCVLQLRKLTCLSLATVPASPLGPLLPQASSSPSSSRPSISLSQISSPSSDASSRTRPSASSTIDSRSRCPSSCRKTATTP